MKSTGRVSQWGAIGVLAVAMALAGCVGLAEKVAQHLTEKSVEHSHAIQVFEGDAARYRECLSSRGGSCPSGAGALEHTGHQEVPSEVTAGVSETAKSKLSGESAQHPAHLAASALSCDTVRHAGKLYSHLRRLPTSPSDDVGVSSSADGSGSTVRMSVSVSGAQKCQDAIARATGSGGWDALESWLRGHLEGAQAGSSEHRDLTADHRRAAFIKAYVDAYFSNGRFLTVDLTVDEATELAKLEDELSKNPDLCKAYNAAEGGGSSSGSVCSALAEKIYRGVLGAALGSGKPLYILKAKEAGFKPRDGGAALQFPQIDVDFDPVRRPMLSVTYGDGSSQSSQFGSAFWLPVGNDLTRVVLEAIFDAHEGLPAVSGATGLSVPDYPLQDIADLKDQNLQQNLGTMLKINQSAGSGVGVVLDRVIRGVGPVSINNESIEQLIVTVVTTSVQKAMEKATWCYFSCDLNEAIAKAEAELKQKTKAEEKKLAGDLRRYAHEETEKVRLELKLTK